MDTNEKHLEFLQNNIGRMNQCSFQMKGWAITIASALIALLVSSSDEASDGSVVFNFIYIYVAMASTVLFWYLDSLYLSKERKFIAIYNDVLGIGNGKNKVVLQVRNYEIPIKNYKGWSYCVFRAMLLPSEIIFYGAIIIGLLLFRFFI